MDIKAEIIRNVLRKVRQLEVRTNRLLDGHLMGVYRSIFKGQGIEFEEVREYTVGDDVRSIDWNITAKMNRPFIKKFREDRELTVLLLIDISASLDFGSMELSKREVVTELASLLAFSANRNNDKVGLLLFSDRIEGFVAPDKGRRHILRIIRDILFHEPMARGTDITAILRHLNGILKKRAIIFLLSDFLQQRSDAGKLIDALEITNRRHDLVCIKIEDPREGDLPDLGLVTFRDPETGEVLWVDTSQREFRERYGLERYHRGKQLEERLKKSAIDLLKIDTRENYLQALEQFLKRRIFRRR
ncbi:MAG: DUF58 domain-containing protein [Puniceicoccales bacterium]|jgi:uncharacterized protein (DUF58 family)|nr:DUF58 domain-containing protein [Puniceicoccales bacterium]